MGSKNVLEGSGHVLAAKLYADMAQLLSVVDPSDAVENQLTRLSCALVVIDHAQNELVKALEAVSAASPAHVAEHSRCTIADYLAQACGLEVGIRKRLEAIKASGEGS